MNGIGNQGSPVAAAKLFQVPARGQEPRQKHHRHPPRGFLHPRGGGDRMPQVRDQEARTDEKRRQHLKQVGNVGAVKGLGKNACPHQPHRSQKPSPLFLPSSPGHFHPLDQATGINDQEGIIRQGQGRFGGKRGRGLENGKREGHVLHHSGAPVQNPLPIQVPGLRPSLRDENQRP